MSREPLYDYTCDVCRATAIATRLPEGWTVRLTRSTADGGGFNYEDLCASCTRADLTRRAPKETDENG